MSEIFSIASPVRDKARQTPNLGSRKSLKFKERNVSTQNIEVEGVERVETVEVRAEG
jgi:hypothetical protein